MAIERRRRTPAGTAELMLTTAVFGGALALSIAALASPTVMRLVIRVLERLKNIRAAASADLPSTTRNRTRHAEAALAGPVG